MKYFWVILLFFLAFGWLVLLISAIGLFYTETVALSILIAAIAVLYFSRKIPLSPPFSKGENLVRFSPFRKGGVGGGFYLVILISIAVSIATCYFATPTVFGGRDQGSIATAAIKLSKNHNLEINDPIALDLFQKYGQGRALNFPGFDYQKDGSLVSRFPIAFTAYLASAYNLFGLNGIQYANFIPLVLFLVLFWLTLREFFGKYISFFGFLLAASFFPFLWFSKYALTEIYMLFLVWSGIYFLIRLTKEKNNYFIWLSLAFFGLSALTRIEGIAFFILTVLYIFILQKKKIITKTKNLNKYLLISAVLLFAAYLYLNFPAILDSAKNFAKAFLPNSTKESAPSAYLYIHLGRIFFSYNILPYLILSLFGILWMVAKFRKNLNNPEFLLIFITFPAFLYLISPMITLDDPWILRRFVFAVFPVLLFYSIYAMKKFFYHKLFLYFVLAALVATNIAVNSRYLTLSENQDLLPQIEKLSQMFGRDDLILVDREATGSGYSLMSEPMRTLYDKDAVYFFNTEDLKYINQKRYKNIYLIAEFDAKNPWYAELIKNNQPTDLQLIDNNFLEPSDKKFSPAVNVKSQNFLGIWKLK